MSWLNNLIRPDLLQMATYHSARSDAGNTVATIAIDANESPWSPFGALSAAYPSNRYPEPQPDALLHRMAAVYGVGPQQILIGRGSDEAIDLLLRLFCRAGQDNIIICPPTFGMYQVYAAVQGAAVMKVPLRSDDWQLNVPAVLKACTDETKLIFIPTPNAPMGHAMKADDILALCKARAEKSLIVADEAYVDFTITPKGLVDELQHYPNLVLLRTLSKAHALAGERVGCAIASAEIVAALKRVTAPYPITQSSTRAAFDALGPNGLIENAEHVRLLISERERMAELLPQSPWIEKVFPSVTNFLLVQTKDSAAFMQHLLSFGIRPRDRHRDLTNTVRLSISTPADNDLVLKALGITVPGKTNAPRLFSARRGTKETAIDVTVNLDAPRFLDIKTGIGFFDHMLAQIASHGGFGLTLHCQGDLHIDQHHTIEDCGLALGEALKGALGDKRGVARFGFTAPLDEAVASVVVDLSGRPYFVFDGAMPAAAVGELDVEMVPHFFRSLATALNASIHLTVKGDNTHHIIESSFKATGRALRQAFHIEGSDAIPSTKGVL